MPHPNLIGGYHEIAVTSSKKKVKPEQDMFIGRFQTDQKYHLLGYRPYGRSDLFSAESESRQDLGVVELPANKSKLSELVKGELIKIISDGKESDSYKVYFCNRK